MPSTCNVSNSGDGGDGGAVPGAPGGGAAATGAAGLSSTEAAGNDAGGAATGGDGAAATGAAGGSAVPTGTPTPAAPAPSFLSASSSSSVFDPSRWSGRASSSSVGPPLVDPTLGDLGGRPSSPLNHLWTPATRSRGELGPLPPSLGNPKSPSLRVRAPGNARAFPCAPARSPSAARPNMPLAARDGAGRACFAPCRVRR